MGEVGGGDVSRWVGMRDHGDVGPLRDRTSLWGFGFGFGKSSEN